MDFLTYESFSFRLLMRNNQTDSFLSRFALFIGMTLIGLFDKYRAYKFGFDQTNLSFYFAYVDRKKTRRVVFPASQIPFFAMTVFASSNDEPFVICWGDEYGVDRTLTFPAWLVPWLKESMEVALPFVLLQFSKDDLTAKLTDVRETTGVFKRASEIGMKFPATEIPVRSEGWPVI